MPYRLATCTAVLVVSACVAPAVSESPLTSDDRLQIADSIRSTIDSFLGLQENHSALCEDPDPIKEFFAFPGGVALSVSDTTPVLETQADWEARGIPAAYWCSLEDVDFRIDSVVVHVLTRDVAVSAMPYYGARFYQAGGSDLAKGMDFVAWLRTEDGWKMTSSMGQYFVETEPRPAPR